MRWNYTLDAPSPVLTYSSDWTPVIESADTNLSDFRNGTAMKTRTTGGSALFTFNGTGVWIYGSKRWNHGDYNVILDTDSTYGNGTTAVGADEFQTLIFGAGNLTSGTHQITLTNEGFKNETAGYLDIDYLVWEGSLSDSSTSKAFANNDAGFQYLPNASWWSYGPNNNSYDGTLYWTQSDVAEFKFAFTGQAIGLYGYLDTDHGNYSCTVDGLNKEKALYSGAYPSKAFRQLICFADSLHEGDHELMVKNLPLSTNDGWFSIDYAEVWGEHPALPEISNHHSSSSHIGAIVGAAVGGILAVLLLGGLFFFLRRRKQEKRSGGTGDGAGGFAKKRKSIAVTDTDRDSFEIDPADADVHARPYSDHDTVGGRVVSFTEASMTQPSFPGDRTSGGGVSTAASFPTSTRSWHVSPEDSISQVGSTNFAGLGASGGNGGQVVGVADGGLEKARYRVQSNTSSSARYLAPQPEIDAGPLILGIDGDEEEEDETRAVGCATLPPVYSSISTSVAGPSPATRPEQAALRDEKPVFRNSGLGSITNLNDHEGQ